MKSNMAQRCSPLLVICIMFLCPGEGEAKRSMVTKRIVRIEKFDNCPDRPNTPEYFKTRNYIDDVRLERVKMEQVINADYVINKPMKNLVAEVQMMKCVTADQTSCEHLMRFKMTDLCRRFTEKNQFYSPFIQSMQPPVKCPLDKPVYRIVNGTFSIEETVNVLSTLPGSMDSYWGVKFTYKDDAQVKEATCLYIVMKVYQLRVKQ